MTNIAWTGRRSRSFLELSHDFSLRAAEASDRYSCRRHALLDVASCSRLLNQASEGRREDEGLRDNIPDYVNMEMDDRAANILDGFAFFWTLIPEL